MVQDNVNPIEKVERSALIVASTIHGVPARELLKADHVNRVTAASPLLLAEEAME